MNNIHTATPTYHWQRILVTGTPFAGKTLSSLYLAKGMLEEGKEIVVVDSEGTIHTYAGMIDKPFEILTLYPYTTNDYIDAINQAVAECPKIGVLIVDDISREYAEIERLKDKHLLDNPRDDKWACWELPHLKPAHHKFMDTLLSVPCHVIATATCREETIVRDGEQVRVNGSPILMKNTSADFDMVFEIMPDTHHFKVDNRLGLFDKGGRFTPMSHNAMWEAEGDVLREGHGEFIQQHLLTTTNGRKSREMLTHELTLQFTKDDIKKKWVAYKEETAIDTPAPSHLDDDAFRLFVGWCFEGFTNKETTEKK